MGKLTVLALRIVIALALAGSLFVQVVMVPLIWADLDGPTDGVRVPFVVTIVCSASSPCRSPRSACGSC